MGKRVASILGVVAVLGVSGCKPPAPEPGKGSDGAPGGKSSLTVGLVTDSGGIDDLSFNASAWAGLQAVARETGVATRYLESHEQSDYKGNLASLADQGSDLVFAIGFLMEDALKEVAPRYPKVKFAIIDGNAPDLPNCVSIKFREEQGCFLAGYLAGRMSKTGAIGFVGGMEGTLIKKFEVGYRAGARTANPSIRVIPKYVGNFVDLPRGKEYAEAEFRSGADIVFQAAGKAGLGVLDAAVDQGPGSYAIGVDADQDHIHPGRILTSMMKGVDSAVASTVRKLVSGQWKAGSDTLGLKEQGVRLSPMKYTRKDVPADALAKLDVAAAMIIDGRLVVPTTEADIQNFIPPKL